jgi:hemoglobin-like flavoprotein
MTEKQIKLVKSSWNLFRQIDPQIIGDVFYSRLFQQMPSLRSMFKGPMTLQYTKIVDTLSMIVSRLDNLEQVNEEIKQLAIRHIHYGVRPAHYKLVGDALIWTLQNGLGNDWDKETAEAWLVCYKILSDTMIKAAATSPAR